MSLFLNLAIMITASNVPTVEATSQDTTTKAAPQKEKKQKVVKICKSSTPDTGSRTARRVCRTKQEWESGEAEKESGKKSTQY
jgi:hypothetical protein